MTDAHNPQLTMAPGLGLLGTFPFDRARAARLLESPETFATVLHVILLSAYGQAVYEIDPLELYHQIDEDFQVQLSEKGENRWNALLMALQSDAFQQDPEAFEAIANALAHGDISDLVEGVVADLTVPEVLWALYEVKLNTEHEEPLAPAVLRLIEEAIAREAGEQEGYVDNFLEDFKVELHTQLALLGVNAEDLKAYLT